MKKTILAALTAFFLAGANFVLPNSGDLSASGKFNADQTYEKTFDVKDRNGKIWKLAAKGTIADGRDKLKRCSMKFNLQSPYAEKRIGKVTLKISYGMNTGGTETVEHRLESSDGKIFQGSQANACSVNTVMVVNHEEQYNEE